MCGIRQGARNPGISSFQGEATILRERKSFLNIILVMQVLLYAAAPFFHAPKSIRPCFNELFVEFLIIRD